MVGLGRCAVKELNSLGLGRFARGREARTVPGSSSRYSWGSSWALSGGLRKALMGSIRYVLVPRWAESGADLAADRTSAIEGGRLTSTVDAESSGGIAAYYY